jgi:molybdenum cofactor guanylyltransferase
MRDVAGIVLAGGRSSRMGSPKAALEWHGSTFLARVAGLLSRALDGPIVVVRAPGQELPPLASSVELAEDARPGGGPLEGIAAGLRAVESRAEVAFISSVDVPLLHPAFVRRVVSLLDEGVDAAIPDVGGRIHPLAGAYRVALLPLVEHLLAAKTRRALDLLDRLSTRCLDEDDLLADREVRACDPALDSLRNLNEPSDYEAARVLPTPPVWVRLRQAPAGPASDLGIVHAATLDAAARAIGLSPEAVPLVALNGVPVTFESELPLVAGDSVDFEARSTQPR